MKRLIARAWVALAFERIWRGLVFPLAVIGLFLCVSWAGLWLEVPHTARIVLVLLFGGLLGYSLVRLIRTAIPSRREALDRIDRVSGFAHHPASVLDDSLANAGQDPVTQALWNLHKRRAANFIGQLRSGAPSPGVTSIDRYALRAGVLVALIACAFLAGPEKYARVAAAFDWRGTGVSGNGYRLDAWIDPPPYTGKAPQLLNLSAPEAKLPDRPMAIEAPVNSTVIVRSSGGETAIDTRGALAEIIPAKSVTANGPARQLSRAAGETERRLLLSGDADLALHHAGGLIGNFEIHVIADRPPSVALTEAPKSNARGSLTLAYRLSDDYGVTSITADFTAPKTPEGDLYTGRSLAAPAHADLSLAPGTGGLGDATTTADLSDHPWAGLRVTMTLAAKDDGGNEGKSEPVEITLPRKPFANPLARAIAEQRRDLLLRPDDKAQVETALSALMIAPEAFGTKDSIYLGLRIASDRLNAAKTDADLVSLADYLWNMALQIENGDLSDAERDMRAAEQKLREALQRNASPEEIRKLTEELRAAMDKFVKELAQKDPNQGTDSSPNQNRGVTPKQLQSMLDQMQELAKSGNMADAQKALDQLQNILENLKSANKQNSDPRARETRRALSDLDRMSKEQQDLRDETYRQSQNEQNGQPSPRNKQRRSQSSRQQQSPDGSQDDRDAEADPNQNGRQGQGQESQDQQSEDQQSGEQLQKRQQALRNRLDQLQKRLNRMGQDEQGLDDAENAMKDAEKGLGEGGEDGQQDAVDAQGRALDSMRKGAQKLAEKLQKGQGQGQPGDGDGEGEDGSSQQSDDSGDSDPLGRPRSNSNHNPGANTPFNPMGTPAVQRAQRVLEELRRRLSDPTRPQEETDYLERLLRRY
jgi:uncharacterized protein (TIGR02302 family)